MFDLITGTDQRPLRERSLGSKIAAALAHGVVAIAVVGIPLLQATNQLPTVLPAMRAFVAPPPAPPPPPPPPLAAAATAKPAVTEPARTVGAFAAPIAAPSNVEPEHLVARDASSDGVLGGVEGGVPGGTLGGIVGGIVAPVAPPPPPPTTPPPPTPASQAPVRIGGQIRAPDLLQRVDPVYPDLAAMAHLTGLVILEAVVNADGCVASVKVLRSRHAVLDKASEEALLQWRYSPLVLNGVPTPFVLTVTFNFSVQK
jgi:protein TonB